MNSDRPALLRVLSKQNEFSAGIHGDRDNDPNPNWLVRELVLSPILAFVRAEKDVIRWLFIVGHDENGTGVAKFPHVGILMHLLPAKPGITTQECVGVGVASKGFPHVADSHKKTNNRGATVGSTGIATFGVTVDM